MLTHKELSPQHSHSPPPLCLSPCRKIPLHLMPLHTQASLPSLPVILGIQNFNHYTFLVELDTQPRAMFNQHKLYHFLLTPVSLVCCVLRMLYCRLSCPLRLSDDAWKCIQTQLLFLCSHGGPRFRGLTLHSEGLEIQSLMASDFTKQTMYLN